MTDVSGVPASAGVDTPDPRRWWVVVVLATCTLVISVDNTILNVALPKITRTLGASASQLQWIVDSYTLVFACLLLLAGALGDLYGRRKMLLIGLAWFAVTAIYAASGHTPRDLIVGRTLMGMGAAFMFPSTLSILMSTFTDPRERGRAIGIWASVSSLAMVIGPLSGGLLVDHFGWHAVFLVNVPFCLVAIVGVIIVVPESRGGHTRRLDVVGALLSITAMVSLLLAIIEAPDWGWTDARVLGAAALAIVLIGAFLWWESHTAEPMMDVSVFRNRIFASSSLTVTLTFFSSFGASLLSTIYFQTVLGFSALRTGLMMTPIAVVMMIVGPRVARLVDRFGTRDVVTAGLTLLVCALMLHASETVMRSVGLGVIARGLLGAGMGLTMPPATMAIMSSLPRERAGIGSAVNDTTRQTGGALGVAVIGSIVSSTYHRFFEAPAALPAAVVEQARESVGRALVVAAKLPGQQAESLVSAARDAYVDAVRYGYWFGAIVLVLTIVFVRRNVPATRLDHSQPHA